MNPSTQTDSVKTFGLYRGSNFQDTMIETVIEIELVTRPAEFELGIWHWAWPPEMERLPCWLQ